MRPFLVLLVVSGAGPFALAQSSPSDPVSTQGQAVVLIETDPDVGGDTLRFAGTPGGVLLLRMNEPDRLTAEALTPGTYTSTLVSIGPELQARGYALSAVECDDAGSEMPSAGDLANQAATFNVEDGETVTCVFTLAASSCLCPEGGTWNVTNHPGTMACTGAVSMTMPLAPSTESGALEIRDECATIYAEGFEAGTAPITMRRDPDCSYRGTVGGEQNGIPMEIHFTWAVQNTEWITGKLESDVSQGGMTCHMERIFELRFVP